MAYPTNVKDQITDSVTQVNTKVLGDAPAMALSNVYQTVAHSTPILIENAISAQQQVNAMVQTKNSIGFPAFYSIGAVTNAVSIKNMLEDLK